MTSYTIGQIIQGEAGSNPAAQFAVASTIYNRGTIGSSSFGSDFNSIVNAPGQFVGNLTGPGGPGRVPPLSEVTPSANTFAGAIQDGTLGNYGETGNAQYFQSNQGQPSSVVGGNSVNIGGNYFSDRFGQPSSSFVAPSYGGTTSPVTGEGSDALTAAGGSDVGSSWQADQGLGYDNGSTMGYPAYNVDGSTPGGIANPALGPSSTIAGLGLGSGSAGVDTASPSGTGAGGAPSGSGDSVSVASDNAPFSGDITNIPVAGVNAPANTGEVNTTAPSSNANSQGQGNPVQITGALPNAVTQAGNTVAKSDTQLGQDIQQAEGSAASAGTSWLGSIFTAGTSLFVRGGFVALGLVLILGAFVFFYAERQTTGASIA